MENQDNNQNRKKQIWLSRLLLVIVLLGFALIVYSLFTGQDSLVVRDENTYQAVFLDNDQVYFGKLRSVNQDLWSLTDIYYLRAGNLQSGQNTGSGAQIDLIKLGAELHAPRDEMVINKAHVIFYEDLNSEGEVMKLIREHKAGNNN